LAYSRSNAGQLARPPLHQSLGVLLHAEPHLDGLAEDLLLHRCECVCGPVLQAAGTWNQDAPGAQPVAGRLDEVVGVGGIGCLRQVGAGQGGLVIEMKITQAQAGLGPALVL